MFQGVGLALTAAELWHSLQQKTDAALEEVKA